MEDLCEYREYIESGDNGRIRLYAIFDIGNGCRLLVRSNVDCEDDTHRYSILPKIEHLPDFGCEVSILIRTRFFKKNWIPDFLKLPKFIETRPDLSGFSICNRALIEIYI